MTDTQLIKELETMEHDIETLCLQNILQRKLAESEKLVEEAHRLYREYLLVLNQYYEHIGKVVSIGRL